MIFIGYAELVEHKLRVAFCVPAVEVGKLRFKLTGADTVLLRKIGLGVKRVLFLHNLNEARIAHQYGAYHLIAVVREMVLL